MFNKSVILLLTPITTLITFVANTAFPAPTTTTQRMFVISQTIHPTPAEGAGMPYFFIDKSS